MLALVAKSILLNHDPLPERIAGLRGIHAVNLGGPDIRYIYIMRPRVSAHSILVRTRNQFRRLRVQFEYRQYWLQTLRSSIVTPLSLRSYPIRPLRIGCMGIPRQQPRSTRDIRGVQQFYAEHGG